MAKLFNTLHYTMKQSLIILLILLSAKLSAQSLSATSLRIDIDSNHYEIMNYSTPITRNVYTLDDKQRIIRISSWMEWNENWMVQQLFYNENDSLPHCIVKNIYGTFVGKTEEYYTYNIDGNVIKKTSKQVTPYEYSIDEEEYTYLDNKRTTERICYNTSFSGRNPRHFFVNSSTSRDFYGHNGQSDTHIQQSATQYSPESTSTIEHKYSGGSKPGEPYRVETVHKQTITGGINNNVYVHTYSDSTRQRLLKAEQATIFNDKEVVSWSQSYSYDDKGRCIEIIHEGTEEGIFAMDDKGEVLNKPNEAHTKTTLEYDEQWAQLAAYTTSLFHTEANVWQPQERKVFVYDQHRRVTEIQVYTDQSQGTISQSWTYTYNGDNYNALMTGCKKSDVLLSSGRATDKIAIEIDDAGNMQAMNVELSDNSNNQVKMNYVFYDDVFKTKQENEYNGNRFVEENTYTKIYDNQHHLLETIIEKTEDGEQVQKLKEIITKRDGNKIKESLVYQWSVDFQDWQLLYKSELEPQIAKYKWDTGLKKWEEY